MRVTRTVGAEGNLIGSRLRLGHSEIEFQYRFPYIIYSNKLVVHILLIRRK